MRVARLETARARQLTFLAGAPPFRLHFDACDEHHGEDTVAIETVTDERRWAALYPDLGTGPVSIEPCISESFFALERERIFRRAWLNVGRESDLDRKSTRLNSSHIQKSRMPSSA